MRRRLLNLAVALSLVLCVGALALWARSYFALDVVTFTDNGGRTAGFQSRGQVGLGVYRVGPGRRAAPTGWEFISGTPGTLDQDMFGPLAFNRFGFAGQRRVDGAGPDAGSRGGVLIVPHWLVAGLLAVAPAGKLVRRRLGRARRRAAAGLCASCGYDLRASAGRCPECGAFPMTGRTAAA